MSEITSIELEALIFTYGEEALTVSQQDPLSIAISIAPHTGEVETEQFVNATLLVATTPEYPGEAPALKLQNPQGMSDKRIDTVMTCLQAETKGLLGEMMLGSLIEAAKDAMTEMNQPEGHCIFCLEQLVPEGISSIHPPLLRLPCYHCYHLQCFAEWWHWQQSSMQQKAEQIQKDLLSAAPQRLQDDGLVPDANGLFAVQCPICRSVVSAQDVYQVHDSTQYAPRDSQQQDSASEMATGFTPKELQKMMLQQQQRAKQFAKQHQQGGIVSERYGTSIAALTGTEQTAASQEAVAHASQQHTYDESGNHASERQTHQSHFRGGSSRNAGHDSGQYSSRQNNRVGAGEPGLYKAQHDAVDLDRGNARGSSRGRKQGRGRAGRGTSTQ